MHSWSEPHQSSTSIVLTPPPTPVPCKIKIFFNKVTHCIPYKNKLGNHKKAIDDYSESIELEHGFVAVYLSRAESYEKLGEDEKAKADHIKAEEIKNNKK